MESWSEAQEHRECHEDVTAGQVVWGAADDHVLSFGTDASFQRNKAGYDIQKYDGKVCHVSHVGCHENIVTVQKACCSSDCALCLWSMWLHTLRGLCVVVHGESTVATRDYNVRNCGAPYVNKNDHLVLFFLAKMPDGAVHNSIQVVRLETHVRYDKSGSRTTVGDVEVSRRYNVSFVQASKEFIRVCVAILGVGLSQAHEVLACEVNKDRLTEDSGMWGTVSDGSTHTPAEEREWAASFDRHHEAGPLSAVRTTSPHAKDPRELGCSALAQPWRLCRGADDGIQRRRQDSFCARKAEERNDTLKKWWQR